MTDATVTFILENLKELIASTSKQISEVNVNVKSLSDDLDFFKGFLQDATKKPIEDAAMKALVKQIRNAVYEAEDIVDEYVIEAAQYKSSSLFSKIKHPLDRPTKLLNLAQKIEPMKAMVKEIYEKKKFGDGARLDGEGSKPSKITKGTSPSGKRGGWRNPALLEAAASRVRILKYGFGSWVSASVQAAFHPVPLEA